MATRFNKKVIWPALAGGDGQFNGEACAWFCPSSEIILESVSGIGGAITDAQCDDSAGIDVFYGAGQSPFLVAWLPFWQGFPSIARRPKNIQYPHPATDHLLAVSRRTSRCMRTRLNWTDWKISPSSETRVTGEPVAPFPSTAPPTSVLGSLFPTNYDPGLVLRKPQSTPLRSGGGRLIVSSKGNDLLPALPKPCRIVSAPSQLVGRRACHPYLADFLH
jgi:hypothetical protein